MEHTPQKRDRVQEPTLNLCQDMNPSDLKNI